MPQVVAAFGSLPGYVLATTNYTITFVFDRPMNPAINPVVTLSNTTAGATSPHPPGPGSWATISNVSAAYTTGPITFGAGMDGLVAVLISGAKDNLGHSMAPTNPLTLNVRPRTKRRRKSRG